VVRRRLTLKRVDPWSVLKFGFVANLVLLAVFLLVAGVVWFIIERLALVEQACAIATDVGFTQCGVNFGNLFRALILLGLLWVVVQTAVLVFLSFLYNLIADLTGGLTVTMYDSTPGAAARGETTDRPSGTVTDTRADSSGLARTGAFAARPGTTGSGTRRGTPAPPVPPLGREPGSGPTRRTGEQPARDPDAASGAGRPSNPTGPTGTTGETMFGDRRRGER
jgi:hypothetical protein